MIPFNKNSIASKKVRLISSVVAIFSIVVTPTAALASSWSPTLLVNTEAFQSIDEGDGSSDIELRFGTTGQELRWNVTDGQFEFDAGLEIHGTASGNIIHAQDTLTSSGGLVVEGSTVLNGYVNIFDTTEIHGTASGDIIHAENSLTSSGGLVVEDNATFNSTITLNGVTYTFPFGDASASGKILASDGAGNLSWTAAGATPNVFQTISVAGQSDIVTDTEADTLSFAAGSNVTITTNAGTDTITISATDTNTTYSAGEGLDLNGTVFSRNATLTGTSLEVYGTASGRTIHAQDSLTSSGGLVTEGDAWFNGDIDATGAFSGSQLTIMGGDSYFLGNVGIGTSSSPETAFEVVGTASGTELHATDSLTSSGSLSVEGAVAFAGLTSCQNLQTDSNGVLSCNNTDYITETELDTEAELESQLTDVSNVIVETEIDSEAELEALVGIDFIKDADIDTLAELEGVVNTTNIIIEADIDSESELEALVGVDFLKDTDLDELVDDRVNGLFRAGSGITFNYDDTNNTFTVNTGFSSGSQISLSPEYAGAVYYGDGSNNVGQLVLDYDTTNKENYYKWTSTSSSLQDYTIAIRAKVPDEFTHWDGSAPIEFRYRTNAASSADNQMDVTMLDTAGSAVSLTSGADLANQSWTTATITGPEGSGTYTPGSYITILITMQARTTNSGEAHAGYLNLNWSTKAR